MASKKIGALWMRKSKDGKQYLSGVLEGLSGDIRIAVFKNDRKQKDNEPDYQIVRSEPQKERVATQTDDFLSQNNGEVGSGEPTESTQNEVNVEDIPF